MAATYKPNWAIDYCKAYVKQINLEPVKLRLLQDVSNEMWMAAPWRWTLGALPVVTLTSDTMDYSVVLPADFLYVSAAHMTDGTQVTTLEAVPVLSQMTKKGMPTMVAVTGAAGTTGTARFFPPPGTVPTNTWNVLPIYKKTAPVLTAQKLDQAGVLGFDDEWAWVFNEGVLAKAYLYADDPRAGSISFDLAGKAQFSGQLGKFQAGLQTMRASEKLPDDTRRLSDTPKKDRG